MTFVDTPCPECQSTSPLHLPRCQFDKPPLNLTLDYLLVQAEDFHHCRPSRGYACSVCGKHARYCGHTRDQMIEALTPGRSIVHGLGDKIAGVTKEINPDNGHGAADGMGGHGEYCDCSDCIASDNFYHGGSDTDRAPAEPRWPTLEAIGLLDALDVVEKVAAGNQGKHPGRKWITKTIAHHDAKAHKHIGAAESLASDPDTGLPSRAHAALRCLMALGLELMRGR